MSSQRGNVTRTRSQKHRNARVFKNDLHDTNVRTKRINQVQIRGVCDKCKVILEWKIKYKKYKPLKAAASCNKCLLRTVKQPYHTICDNCARSWSVCPKCGIKMEFPVRESLDQSDETNMNVKCNSDNEHGDESNESNEEYCSSDENQSISPITNVNKLRNET